MEVRCPIWPDILTFIMRIAFKLVQRETYCTTPVPLCRIMIGQFQFDFLTLIKLAVAQQVAVH